MSVEAAFGDPFTPREIYSIRATLQMRVLWPIVKKTNLGSSVFVMDSAGSIWSGPQTVALPPIKAMAKFGERILLLSNAGQFHDIRIDRDQKIVTREISMGVAGASVGPIDQFVMVNGRIFIHALTDTKRERLLACSFTGNCEEMKSYIGLVKAARLPVPEKFTFTGDHSPELGTAGDFVIRGNNGLQVPMSLLQLYWMAGLEGAHTSDDKRYEWHKSDLGQKFQTLQRLLSENRFATSAWIQKTVIDTIYENFPGESCGSILEPDH